MTDGERLRVLEDRLWKAADTLRASSSLAASQYSVPVLGLIFLRYADVRFTQVEHDIAQVLWRIAHVLHRYFVRTADPRIGNGKIAVFFGDRYILGTGRLVDGRYCSFFQGGAICRFNKTGDATGSNLCIH